jgi:hypothetical protein
MKPEIVGLTFGTLRTQEALTSFVLSALFSAIWATFAATPPKLSPVEFVPDHKRAPAANPSTYRSFGTLSHV